MTNIPQTMSGVLLTGHGDTNKLEYRSNIDVPEPRPDEVLIRVKACGMNNTDINTRTGWYSKSVTEGSHSPDAQVEESGGSYVSWGGKGISFPRIQGADIAGDIVAVGNDVSPERIGEKVIVDCWLRDKDDLSNRYKSGYVGSECDGGYAQFTSIPARNVFATSSTLDYHELATFPCSYSTAEYMLTRARLQQGESIIIPGASGGVGSALIQLAKRRGATVYAIAGRNKLQQVSQLGADHVFARDDSDHLKQLANALPDAGADVLADIVGGGGFPLVFDCIKRGGRYVTSGAIAGPIVELDLRTLYLNDLEMHGATVMLPELKIFDRLLGYIDRAEIKPLVAKTFPLRDIAQAQKDFLKKTHVGNFVMIPE